MHYATLLSNEKITICYLDYQLVITASHKLYFDTVLKISYNSNIDKIIVSYKIISIHVVVLCIVSYFLTNIRVTFFHVTIWLRTFVSLLFYITSYPASCPFCFFKRFVYYLYSLLYTLIYILFFPDIYTYKVKFKNFTNICI